MATEYRVKGKKKDRVVSSRDSTYDGLRVASARPTAPYSPEVEARVRAVFRDRRSP